jgi:hypothetical protein
MKSGTDHEHRAFPVIRFPDRPYTPFPCQFTCAGNCRCIAGRDKSMASTPLTGVSFVREVQSWICHACTGIVTSFGIGSMIGSRVLSKLRLGKSRKFRTGRRGAQVDPFFLTSGFARMVSCSAPGYVVECLTSDSQVPLPRFRFRRILPFLPLAAVPARHGQNSWQKRR